jgi:hypothetical protein
MDARFCRPDGGSRWLRHLYNQGALATGEGLYFNPYFNLNINVPYPGVPPVTLQNPFPANYPVRLPSSATRHISGISRPAVSSIGAQACSVSLGAAARAGVAYVGSRGHDLIAARDMNQPRPSAAPVNLRPNPLLGDITLIESRGTSNTMRYKWEVSARLDRGVSIPVVVHTWGNRRTMRPDSSRAPAIRISPGQQQSAAEYGRSSFDVHHRFSLSFSAELPFPVVPVGYGTSGDRYDAERPAVYRGVAA